MAITQTGSTLEFLNANGNANAGTVSSTITVPGDAELVCVTMWNFCSTAGYFTSGVVTFTKGSTDTAMTLASGSTAAMASFNGGSCLWYLVLPDTGSNKSLKWDWDGTGLSDRTNNFGVTFWTGIDTASPVRDSQGVAFNGSLPATTPSLTAQSGDLIIAWGGGFNGGAEGAVATWNNLTTLSEVTLVNAMDGTWATGAPSGNTTVGVASLTNISASFGGLVATVFKPAGGGGGGFVPSYSRGAGGMGGLTGGMMAKRRSGLVVPEMYARC